MSTGDFEGLGVFYLGRRYDGDAKRVTAEPILYDSRDLVTHAVCAGMTGSGKTGLCLALIEEALLDGVPVIAIDPKGDIANLLLTFPGLSAAEFRPWIEEDEARRAGADPEAFAAQEAARWKQGLAEWGQDGARIDRLRAAAELAVYTPGSRAGLPVSIVSSLAAPPPAMREGEALDERASATATSLLALAGADATPRGREHTLLATILGGAWRDGRALDLPALIQQVQSPPFQKLGVLDVETFFPAAQRFELAMKLNAVIASPGFASWLEGEPLDPAILLHTSAGRPRAAIFSIAHLGDSERMFFVSLLLNQVVTWMRTQPGTTSLRAIVYMDEILGYFPPVENPPSKGPLLTLLKQGRAFGLGVLLATQNPVDLDYKGLGNTGTWFLGRLQTERDKARVLDGLEGASGGPFDRAWADAALSTLPKRVFLLHDVHEQAPVLFQTRWTLSYLRGPLTRTQIAQLMAGRASEPKPAAPPPATAASTSASPAPVLPPGIDQYFVPGPTSPRYEAVALGAARVSFFDAKLGVDEAREIVAAAPIDDGPLVVDWTQAEALDLAPADLGRTAAPGATFGDMPRAATVAKNYASWRRTFTAWIAESQALALLRHAPSGMTSRPGESERDFRVRVETGRREARDQALDEMRHRFEKERARLDERLRKAQERVDREQSQASHQKLQTAVSMGATLLGALLGRRRITTGTLGRATTAARGVGRSMREQEDVQRAAEGVDAVRGRIADLEAAIAEETKKIAAEFESRPEDVTTVAIAPKKSQITVQFVALGWRPR